MVFVEEERKECERALKDVMKLGMRATFRERSLRRMERKFLSLPTSTREEMQMVIRSEQSLLYGICVN
jgi:hypothetical protein